MCPPHFQSDTRGELVIYGKPVENNVCICSFHIVFPKVYRFIEYNMAWLIVLVT